MSWSFDLPAAVRAKAEAVGAGSWTDDLPDLVAALADEWALRIGATFPDATEALVVEATRADGSAAVLKLCVPRALDAARREIAVLRRAAGDGCVRLLAADAARGALLLERLGPSLADLGVAFDERQEVLVATAARVWRPAPDMDLPTGTDKAHDLMEFIEASWHELGGPCSRAAVDHAAACARRRAAAHDPARAVLVHGDVHQWNALRSADGFALVDPDGLLAEPEYDLGVLLREDPVELMAGDPWERAVTLAGRLGLDAEAAWEWGVVERVSTGLLCVRIGLHPIGPQMLAAADALAAA